MKSQLTEAKWYIYASVNQVIIDSDKIIFFYLR